MCLKIHKHNIRKWDSEEVYLQDPQPREMTCRQSLRNSEDPEFKEAFISNIQLFMHREHLNITEWNRLSQFSNPFGFMGYNYTVVKQAVDLIPKPRDHQLLPVPTADKQGCIRCAVVATGGILNGSRMGKEIDSHDYVFRMNGAVVRGHEEDVGTRTSVFVHTAHSLVALLSSFPSADIPSHIPVDEGIRYVLILERLWDFHFLRALLLNMTVPVGKYNREMPIKYFLGHFDINKYYVLHPDFLRYIRNRYLKSWHLNALTWHMFRPTNEAFSLFLAVHLCDVVDAYGFITGNHRKYPNYYFKKNQSEAVFYMNHNYKLEIDLWERLHASKIIKLYQRQEDIQL
ncbi:alpha-N-acetylgalactosaminide alpha-2,6-sialyltransferase 1-like [Megalops cyprinoides]|uniref:alpha-N-acetylgalactosaminide alpha-2,6-sialyltransferase 1-like n=1 Tax=Megalops cyprinoides TaxID=118141 RepID=UPI00186485BC|nr:alpha-N-acetylgalactosaminide alpha-2,6-sialyltransferase 1-like [Megalops cyprinoides]